MIVINNKRLIDARKYITKGWYKEFWDTHKARTNGYLAIYDKKVNR